MLVQMGLILFLALLPQLEVVVVAAVLLPLAQVKQEALVAGVQTMQLILVMEVLEHQTRDSLEEMETP
jgi:hypothetical protein